MTAILTIETRLSSRFNFGELESIKSKIANLNLDQIIGKVAHDENLSIDEVREIAQQYKQFVYLAGAYGDVTPTKDIDLVWHAHILDTEKYDSFCHEVFGRKIHHLPTYSKQEFGRGNFNSEAQERTYYRTIKLFEKEFGHNPFKGIMFSGCNECGPKEGHCVDPNNPDPSLPASE
jgi:hypothetical protein